MHVMMCQCIMASTSRRVVGLVIAAMRTSPAPKMDSIITLLVLLSVLALAHGKDAVLTLLKDGPSKGAMCLDGSPPGYYYRAGQGDGSRRWLIHQEGGGWCYNEADCYGRSKTALGSSDSWGPSISLGGILSDDPVMNSKFWDWNVAFLKYCDGASFSGHTEKPITYNNKALYFRGKDVLLASLDSLHQLGMADATDIILTGCSAGGLATYLHADFVQNYVGSNVKYAAIADAGYFLDAANTKGEMVYRSEMQYVFKMQNVSGGVNQACIKANPEPSSWKCIFAPYTFSFIKAPVFVLNSQYDTWQLGNILQLGCTPPQCSEEQMKFFNNYHEEFLAQASPAVNTSRSAGVFIDSCLEHCQSLSGSLLELKVGGQSALETIEDWYFSNPGQTKEVDCAYPCNKCRAS